MLSWLVPDSIRDNLRLEISGPVAQRLEQGTHNSLQALGSLLYPRDGHDSQRLQTTIKDAENGNKWQPGRGCRRKKSLAPHRHGGEWGPGNEAVREALALFLTIPRA
jgi:hypothetical protein